MDKKRLRRQFILDTMDPNHQELVRVFTELMQSPFRNFFPLSKFAEPMANGKLKIKESPSTFLQEAKAFLAATEMRGFNRRDFLKTLGYSAGALTLWSNEAEANPMMTFFANSGNKAREIANAVTYADDVFSTYLYTGNGTTQTISNGIDLAGKGGLVWTKVRTGAGDHLLHDSVRGITNMIYTDGTVAQANQGTIGVTSFNASGYVIGNGGGYNGSSASTYVSWTFRKAAKFFDIVTYTGNNQDTLTISHSLGVAPGMVIVKAINATSDWVVWHRGDGTTDITRLSLNTTAAGNGPFNATATATTFRVGRMVNGDASYAPVQNGVTYIAYLFAHDTSANGIIQCGSFSTNGGGGASVTLGWEPQYLMIKAISSGTTENWRVFDTARNMPNSNTSVSSELTPNLSSAEAGTLTVQPNATGFYPSINPFITYIYLAIRRPNKPPTSGTQVYSAIARNGTGSAATVTGVGFPPDLVISTNRNKTQSNFVGFLDRLRGASPWLDAHSTAIENSNTVAVSSLDMDGVTVGADNGLGTINYNFGGTGNYVTWFFRRAPGVFDIVCWHCSDTTSSNQRITHTLGAAPELIITKARNQPDSWFVWTTGFALNQRLILNSNAGISTSGGAWNSSTSTVSDFGIVPDGTGLWTNGKDYIAYLFATKSGISKVGSYTGDGTTNGSKVIACGFTTGARFILIKRTDSTGDWFVWDTARGITASANDPHLSLNTAAAEVTTDDSIDPDNSGFKVKQNTTTNINVSSATYIFLAIA